MQGQATSSIRTKMAAAQIVAPRVVEIVELAVPDPGHGQVRIRLEGCGVCASNIPPFEGREWFTYPMSPGALGHEGWGVVDAVGAGVSSVREGDRVAALSQNAYAEYDLADAGSVVKLPPSLDGQPFPGEPLGCAVNIFKRCAIRPGDTVAIVGIGFLGALLTQLAVGAGAKVVAIARRPYAQQVAREMGAATVMAMDDHWRIIEGVKELTGGTFADVVIEAVGKQWPLDLAAELTKERGRLVVAGYHQDGPRQVNMQLWNWRGLDVINAHEREHQVYIDGMAEAVRRVEEGTLRPQSLYTNNFQISELGQALEQTNERPEGFMKALIRYGGGSAPERRHL
jgi:NADPH:quinone reductase